MNIFPNLIAFFDSLQSDGLLKFIRTMDNNQNVCTNIELIDEITNLLEVMETNLISHAIDLVNLLEKRCV